MGHLGLPCSAVLPSVPSGDAESAAETAPRGHRPSDKGSKGWGWQHSSASSEAASLQPNLYPSGR